MYEIASLHCRPGNQWELNVFQGTYQNTFVRVLKLHDLFVVYFVGPYIYMYSRQCIAMRVT